MALCAAFLSSLGVMDYSLLVGFDKQGQELVVGVIDFIRQVRGSERLCLPVSVVYEDRAHWEL
jgi:hypothetical protein